MKSLGKLVWPYVFWLGVLIVIPGAFILLASVSTFQIFNDYDFRFSSEPLAFLMHPIFLNAFKNSLWFAGLTTLICLVLGYPVAYFFARMEHRNKSLFVAFLIVPVWSNMIVRIIAWENIFKPVSIINLFDLSFNLIGSDTAIIIAMVSMYLPFMVFPIYAVLEKMDPALIEASRDLGATHPQTFIRVTLPLSLGGIVSGVIMTLLPAMTAFALPERIGGGRILLLGNVIEKEIFRGSFSHAAVVSMVVMVVMLALFMLIIRFDKEGETLL